MTDDCSFSDACLASLQPVKVRTTVSVSNQVATMAASPVPSSRGQVSHVTSTAFARRAPMLAPERSRSCETRGCVLHSGGVKCVRTLTLLAMASALPSPKTRSTTASLLPRSFGPFASGGHLTRCSASQVLNYELEKTQQTLCEVDRRVAVQYIMRRFAVSEFQQAFSDFSDSVQEKVPFHVLYVPFAVSLTAHDRVSFFSRIPFLPPVVGVREQKLS